MTSTSDVPPTMDIETSTEPASQSASVLMEDCLKLLRGENDSQRLAGLLLATKLCNKDDHSSVLQVYHALGPKFLLRLLHTGMDKGGGGGENGDAYLELSVTVLAAFCRVPQIAASPHMLSIIPLLLQILSKDSCLSVIENCYEFIYLVSNAHEDGVRVLFESGGIQLLASQISSLPDGSHVVELAIGLVQLTISKLPAEEIYIKHPSELAMLVVAVARQFALLQTALKFQALHLLSAILSSQYSAPVHEALRLMDDIDFSTNMRAGVVAILHNRVALAQKLQALFLAECSVSIVGEEWLIGPVKLPDARDPIPSDRCILLVLESSRVEIAVLLNELAYFRDEASKSSPSNSETILMKCKNLGILFSLVEKVIKLVSKLGEDEESQPNAVISDSNFMKIISGLNETISVVLEYLQDAREHGQNRGDDLLASVRIIGSYLAETPQACREKVKELLSYMLSVQGEDELCPFYSTCFLLPMLCQITMSTDGCVLFASSGAFKAVIEYLISSIVPSSHTVEDNGAVFLACDTILNFLLDGGNEIPEVDASLFRLLGALSHWTEETSNPDIIMTASSICTLILDSTSWKALLCHPDFSNDGLNGLVQLTKKSLAICAKGTGTPADTKEEVDLHQIVTAGYSRWADRFPGIKEMIEKES